MGRFTWIKMLLFLLQLRAITGYCSSFTVRHGDEVTLPCENTIDQDNCGGTTWLFNNRETSQVVELVSLGQTKSDRLNVAENCSLIIKKVTDEDVGYYHCRQFNKSGQQQGPDALVNVSVINIHERKEDDKVTLICTVLTYKECGHAVQWLYQANKDHFTDLKSSQSFCSATVTLTTSSLSLKTKCDQSFKCNVTDRNSGQQLLFDFNLQSSCEKAVVPYWAFIIVAVGLAALLITVGVFVSLRRNKGNKTQMDNDTRQKSNPEVTQPGPETNQHMPLLRVDTKDGVAYASISYTKTTNRKAQAKDDEEGDTVTYSTVKTSSSTPGACSDPSILYATIRKTNTTQAPV